MVCNNPRFLYPFPPFCSVEGTDNVAFDFSDMRMTRAATLDEAELDQLTDLFSDFPLAGEEQPPIPLEPMPPENSRNNNLDNNNVNDTPATEAVEGSRPQRVSVTSNRASSAAKKRRLMINLIVQSFGFLLLFTAYQSLQNLQSSINDDRNIGQTSLAVLYGVLILSCPFLAPVVMGLFGLKWTITGSMMSYVIFTIANYWLEFYTLIPASVLVGAAAACLWAANGAYLTELAIKYAQVSKENLSVVITRFFGIFFGIFQTSQIWGNLISSLVLQQGADRPGPVPEANLSHCGASHCPDAGDVSFTLPQGDHLRRTLMSIYLACGVLAVFIMALFADRMKETELPHCLDICKRKPPAEAPAESPGAEREEEASATDWRLLCDRFIVAWRFMFQEKRMMLLIPLITYGTMQQALNVAVFTRAFVGCTLGVHWIGYVMICYGVCDAFSAFLIGRIRNWVPRQALVAVGGLLNLSLMVHLLAMTPHPQYAAVFFVHVGLWGVADAIWQTQINSLYGVLFPGCQEVAFSMDGFWGAIGYTVAFSYGGYLCASVKIYILLSLLGVSMTTYTVLEDPAGMPFSDLSITRRYSLGEELPPELGNSTDQLAHKNSQAKTGIDNMEFSDVSKKEDGTDAGAITPSYQNAEGSTDPLETTAIPKWRVWKNLLVICCAFLFNFTAFQSLQNLQSSLNYDEGLGVASLSVIYASLIVSCIFVPPILIGKIGCKWTLVVSIFWYSVFTAGNFYASWYTLMPFSVTLGLAGAPLWTAKSKYVTTSGMRYAGMVGETQEDVITMFFGIFFMVFQSGQIWGNLISSLVLERGNVTSLGLTPEELSAICGANNCPNSTGALQPPTTSTVNLLVGIYLGCGLFAVLVLAVFLDKLKGEGEEKKPGLQLLIATLKHLKDDKRQVLLVPITIYSGLEQAYVAGDYTKSFVSCALGIEWIGYVMICYGVCDAIFSFLLGRLIKLTGRIPLFVTGAVAHLAMIITMLVWSPDPGKLEVFFVLAAFWGLGDAVWQLEINALYGYLFRKNQEAGFSNYRLWESLGFVVAFAYSNFLCTDVKLYILLAVLVLGMMGYALVEYNERKDPEESDTRM
ncbi:PREDICTED: uncharacterized protein LOC109481218 [Branchiostoma belcheri]|uniref:Protein unc-93 homolog A n=1 Tax=Branchiostoma belcheri TaxID=7741 RepID=A0A6P4ZZ63_BRABE|nr:PREDICTED: uncharacterized protein LOC109481218 [Branchiostoma belcheri]